MKQSVSIVGVINVSPESFYKGSVKTTTAMLAQAARQMELEGADVIDVGAMSTAPYLKTQISEAEEALRLANAVRTLKKHTRLLISADTYRFEPASAALDAGADILNDITGLHGDSRVADVAKHASRVILMAHPTGLKSARSLRSPIDGVEQSLRSSLKRAAAAKIARSKIILDPGIGFFRNSGWPWWKWDLNVLGGLERLAKLQCPLLVGVSRKSFLGEILKQPDPNDRLSGSLAATAWAVLNGARWVRTHDVKATLEALTTLAAISGR